MPVLRVIGLTGKELLLAHVGRSTPLSEVARQAADALGSERSYLVSRSALLGLGVGSTVETANLASGDTITAIAGQRSLTVFASRNGMAFAAITPHGSVVTWGDADSGGDCGAVRELLEESVVQVAGTGYAFAAVKADGSVVTWGDTLCGGDSGAVRTLLAKDVVEVASTFSAFAAIKADGSVITWGDSHCGGDSSSVRASLAEGVVQVAGTFAAFAAVKADDSVVTWGSAESGGDCTAVRGLLMGS
mmetsp:Transcript_45187/g.125700  ORF Transcript_45187/g.125700 Transcript_45187/m.125700 type:complete len:247 (-) Transcript_45187:76-816(-)